MSKNLRTINFITKVSILAVLSFILFNFRFPLPIAPSFYEMDFVNVPTLIGGFALGPFAAFSIEIIRTVLKLIFFPTSTFFVGEISGLIVNLALVVPAAYFYKKHKNFKGAIFSLIVGSFCFTLAGALSNYYFILPAYVKMMNFPAEKIIALGKVINPNINSFFSLVIICTTPFNIIKSLSTSVIVALLYKRISFLLKNTYFK